MLIKWKKDITLEMVGNANNQVSFSDRNFKKGDISDVEILNDPKSEGNYSFNFLDTSKISCGIKKSFFEIVK